MKILILSDIHANLAAFEAVLNAGKNQHEMIICLGDLVGYGPEPDACVLLAQKTCDIILAGNHDFAACGKLDLNDFSYHAKKAMEWTQSILSLQSLSILQRLKPITEYNGILLSHGSPLNPIWDYILDRNDAASAFNAVNFDLCFFGHSHIPCTFSIVKGKNIYPSSIKAQYGSPDNIIVTDVTKHRFLLNPGSIGFPRDAMDAHSESTLKQAIARYAIFDTANNEWTFQKVEYNLEETARKMSRLGLW